MVFVPSSAYFKSTDAGIQAAASWGAHINSLRMEWLARANTLVDRGGLKQCDMSWDFTTQCNVRHLVRLHLTTLHWARESFVLCCCGWTREDVVDNEPRTEHFKVDHISAESNNSHINSLGLHYQNVAALAIPQPNWALVMVLMGSVSKGTECQDVWVGCNPL